MKATTYAKLSDAEVVALSKAAFGSGPSDAPGVPAWLKAACVCLAESSGNPNIVNPIPVPGCNGPGSTHATGLWQIVPSCHPKYTEERLTDPAYNAYAASEISGGGTNWDAWSTSNRHNPSQGRWAAYKGRVATGAADPLPKGGSSLLDKLPHIPNPLDTATDAASAAIDTAQALSKLFAFVTNHDNWMRLLWIALGWTMTTTGLVIIYRDTLTRTVAAVATDGLSEVGRAAT